MVLEARLKQLLEFCREGNRVCPHPQEWNRLWKTLPDRQREGGSWSPPLPLILAAWWETSDEEKRRRFEQHIRWAHDHGSLEAFERAIRCLSEDQWYHSGN